MRGLSLLPMIAACSPPSGLTLEVVVHDPAIDRVELFVGDDCSGDCPRGIVPPELPAMTVTDAYVVVDAVPWSVTEFEDGVAGFRIESPEDTSLAILVAIGYDAQDQIRWSATFHDVAVPSDEAVHWRVKLSPTTPIAAPTEPQPAGTERIKRWQQPSQQLPSCLLIEHWTGSAQPSRDLVVPDGDRDCDELPETAECAPWIPNAVAAPPTLDDANCVVAGALPNASSAVCLIGGPECTEDPAVPRKQCVAVAEPHCVSDQLCQCTGRPDFEACVKAVVTDGIGQGLMPFMKCAIQIDEEGYRCDDNPIEADAGAYLKSGPTHCTAFRLNNWSAPLGQFSSALQVDATSKLKLTDFTEPCKVDVLLEGNTTAHALMAAAELDLDNGNHLVVPAYFEFKAGGCNEQSWCELFTPTNADSLWECVTPTAMACAPEPNSTCAGPMCGAECCGDGEMCTPNGCSCAGGARCTGGDTCRSPIDFPGACGTTCCGIVTPCPF